MYGFRRIDFAMHMQCNYNRYLQAGTHPPESCSMNSQHELSAWELNMMVADATSLHTNSQHELSTSIFVALHIDRRALAAIALAKGVGRKALADRRALRTRNSHRSRSASQAVASAQSAGSVSSGQLPCNTLLSYASYVACSPRTCSTSPSVGSGMPPVR